MHGFEELESIFQSDNNRPMNVLQITIYNEFMLVLCSDARCKLQRNSNGQLTSQSSFIIFISFSFGIRLCSGEKKNISLALMLHVSSAQRYVCIARIYLNSQKVKVA